MRLVGWGGLFLSLVLVTGCATSGRNYQTDIDALNARINALQWQLTEKDQEISKLQYDMKDQRTARETAENALKSAEAERQAMAAKAARAASAADAAVSSGLK